MTRREFLRRSAPLVAAGAVSPVFLAKIIQKLFGPKRYWDFGAVQYDPELRFWIPKFRDDAVITLFEVPKDKKMIFPYYNTSYNSVLQTTWANNCPFCEAGIPVKHLGSLSGRFR